MKSFTTLFSESWAIFTRALMALLIVAAALGVVQGVASHYLRGNVEQQMQKSLGALGMDVDRLKQMQKLAEMDEQAAKDYADEMQKNLENLKQDQAVSAFGGAFLAAGKMAFWSILLSFVLTGLLMLFATILTVTGKSDVNELVTLTTAKFLPFLGLELWVMVRSFIWLAPVFGLGIVLAIIFGPRLALAPTIFVQEGKGVFESATLSYQRSAGHWLSIFGYTLLVGILVAVVLMVLGIAFAMAGGLVGSILAGIASMLGMAFSAIYLTKLSQSVMGK